ncbi:hypothetical protein AOLI_G00191350 [Acnodon oligacanthus]
MAEPADPGAPHPSLCRCDLFFLAGDPATLCPKTEVLDRYCSSPRILPFLPTPPSINPSMSPLFLAHFFLP